MKIGITERGDAALDLSWSYRLGAVDAAILITKNAAGGLFQNHVLMSGRRIIVHATVTFLGKAYEPNVPESDVVIDGLERFIGKGFPAERIVLRLDPLMRAEQVRGFFRVAERIRGMGISRVRFSFLDVYPHVRRRFVDRGLPSPAVGFTLEKRLMEHLLGIFVPGALDLGFSVESCAERIKYPGVETVGCISAKDLALLGFSKKGAAPSGRQRKDCLCIAGKTELLAGKHPCAHGCVYCYWKRPDEL